MLPLDSPGWHALAHAYGPASDIPELLRQLPNAGVNDTHKTEPWVSLWSALCHQRDVYTASYAAVAHILAEASERPPDQRLPHLHLAGYIEICRHRFSAPQLPEFLAADYHAAVALGGRLTLEALEHRWDDQSLQALLAVYAGFRGAHALGSGVMDSEPQIHCPECDALITFPGYELFEPSS